MNVLELGAVARLAPAATGLSGIHAAGAIAPVLNRTTAGVLPETTGAVADGFAVGGKSAASEAPAFLATARRGVFAPVPAQLEDLRLGEARKRVPAPKPPQKTDGGEVEGSAPVEEAALPELGEHEYVVTLFVSALQTLLKAVAGGKLSDNSVASLVENLLENLSHHPAEKHPNVIATFFYQLINKQILNADFLAPQEAAELAKIIFQMKANSVPVEQASQILSQQVTQLVEAKIAEAQAAAPRSKGRPGRAQGQDAGESAPAADAAPAPKGVTIDEIRAQIKETKDVRLSPRGDKVVNLSSKVSVQIKSNLDSDIETGRGVNRAVVTLHIFADSDEDLKKTLFRDVAVIVNDHVNRQFGVDQKGTWPLMFVVNVPLTEGVVKTDEEGNGLIEVFCDGVLYRFHLPLKKRRLGF